ncbi:UbiA prenyltransferase family-domain-containing protein [Talaromyces proteolyticus]|uniref:UbiA prenyltransferase family-domain-containing protein n=1 Tax=Talaromyces proteolyticus TaxID=1131652 RepID=A0AAD4KKD3_9EURO|nr:UbiA prenyltransferase family-domain-containing protein [Talaromyces proteolyticus]KAH8694201.1 UbiA prenyltransferase family-domain-containing protein [Talaromyces proteolyticus]
MPLFSHFYTLWLFTKSDFKTVIFPTTAFAIFNTFSGGFTENDNDSKDGQRLHFASRILIAVIWTWLHLLMENIANQRLPHAILEDRLNKPWRPICSGRVNEEGARHLLLVTITLSCGLSFALDILGPSVALVVFTYMYNDLGGADDSILRNVLNACGLLSFGAGATAICGGSGFRAAPLTSLAYGWFMVVAATITTTVSVQDLEDCEGDRARGRQTLPLVLGDEPTRYILSALIIAWTTICPIFWNVSTLAYIPPLLFGLGLILNLLRRRHLSADKVSWRLWCVWMMVLYSLPCLQGDLRSWSFSSLNALLQY